MGRKKFHPPAKEKKKNGRWHATDVYYKHHFKNKQETNKHPQSIFNHLLYPLTGTETETETGALEKLY